MIKFGPSGNSISFKEEKYKSTIEAAVWCKARGLDWYEYSFGRGITLGEKKAIEIGEVFYACGLGLSVHAPYFINFATEDEQKAQNSFNYVLNSAKMAGLMKGNRVVFHSASQGKMEREYAVRLTEERLKQLRDKVYEADLDNIYFCPETMGKLAQIGTVKEITCFCKIDKIFLPAVDFGHINAREQGSLKTVTDYKCRLEYMIGELGYEKMKNFHVHFSKIQYSTKGEIRHLTFEDTAFGPEFEPLAVALKELKLEPVIVCESAGTQAEDAMEMKKIYLSL